jgi:hypothetical protein
MQVSPSVSSTDEQELWNPHELTRVYGGIDEFVLLESQGMYVRRKFIMFFKDDVVWHVENGT